MTSHLRSGGNQRARAAQEGAVPGQINATAIVPNGEHRDADEDDPEVHPEGDEEEADEHHDDHDEVDIPEGHYEGDGHDHSSLMTHTQSTASGYDVDSGAEPICWLTGGTASPTIGVSSIEEYPYVWHTRFAADFYSGPTDTMSSCFGGFELHVEAPRPEEREEGGRLYIEKEYTYRVRGQIDMSSIRSALGQTINVYGEGSDSEGHSALYPRVSVEVIFCRIRTMGGGLCSPFVYQNDVHGDSYVKANDGTIHDHTATVDHGADHSEDGGQQDEENGGDHSEAEELEEHEYEHDHATEQELDDEHDHGVAVTVHDDHAIHYEEEFDNDDHVHAFLRSEVIMFDVAPNQTIVNLTADIPFRMAKAESVFAIAAVRTLLSPGGPSTVFKFDSSNIVAERVLIYENPPQVNTVSQGTLAFSYALIGLVGLGIAALLFFVAKHRRNNVFQLSQGGFLILFLASALVASASSFLLNPKSTLYCKLYGPLIMIPLQLMVAVVICRLWRIHVLMQPLLGWADKHTKIMSTRGARRAARRWLPTMSTPRFTSSQTDPNDSTASTSERQSRASRVQSILPRCRKPPTTPLRRKVTAKHMSLYIFLITLPQILVQILHAIIAPYEQDIYWNDDMSIGREHCHSEDVKIFNWLSYAIFFVTVLVLLLVAFRTRNLPSLFNEANGMFSTVIISTCVAAVGIALILATNEPTASPDVGYLVAVVIVLCFTGQMSWRIVWPKVQLVRSGEAVVVSKLFQEHSSKKMNGAKPSQQSFIPSTPVVDGAANGSNVRKEDHVHFPNESSITFDDGNPDPNGSKETSKVEEEHHKKQRTHGVTFSSVVSSTESTHESMHITEDCSPPRELTMMLLQLSQLVTKSNSRMLSGMQISRSEWQEIRDSIVRMGHIFEDDVKFDWTEAEQNGKES